MGDSPVYVVYLNAICRENDILRFKEQIVKQLDGTVVVVDAKVDRIEQLSPADKSRLIEVITSESEV